MNNLPQNLGTQRNKAIAVICAGMVLSGCSTPVPEALPTSLLPNAFSKTDNPTVWPDAEWWNSFGDNELVSLVNRARVGNLTVASAAANVVAANALASISKSALFPQISGGLNHANGGCSGQSCLGFTRENDFGLNFNASYELDFWGLRRDNLRAATEQAKSAKFAEETAALTVVSNVAIQYFTILSLRKRISIAKENLAAIDGILDVIKLRAKAGSTSHLDMAQESAQEEAVRSQLSSLVVAERAALYSLAVLVGVPPEGFDIVGENLDGVRAPSVAPGIPAELLVRRPDVAQAEANLASAHANVDAARAAFFPQISLNSSAGFFSTALGTLLQGSQFGYNYGFNILQTIFDGGRLTAQKDWAKAVEKSYIANYQYAALNAYADVETTLVRVSNSQQAVDHLQREIASAQEAFAIAGLQYRQGAADLLTVLQTQQTLFSAEDQLVQAVLANRVAIVNLYEALGGGWQEAEADRTQFAGNSADKSQGKASKRAASQ